MLSKALGSLQKLRISNTKSYFTLSQKSSQYRDRTPLKEEEINKILYKNVQKTKVDFGTPDYTLDSPAYNEKIEELLERVKEAKEQNEITYDSNTK